MKLGFYKQFGDKVSLDIAGYLNDYDNLIESRTLTIKHSIFNTRMLPKPASGVSKPA